MEKRRNGPEIRFEGFFDDWEQRKLESMVQRLKSYPLSRDIETNENTGYKYIHYGDIHTKVANVIDKSTNLPNIKAGNYELLQKGDLVVADASEDYKGIATPAVVTIKTPYKLVSGLHTISLRPKQVSSLFLYYLIKSPIFRRYGFKVGTGMKVFGISTTNLFKFESMFPSLEEQKRIGIFLKKIDDTIALHQEKRDKLNLMKKGFLQLMFPQNGKTVPPLRFANFVSPWEQRKLGDLYAETHEKGNDSLQILSVSIHDGVSGGELDSDTLGKTVRRTEDKSVYKHVYQGNLVFNMMRAWQGAIGIVTTEGMVSPAYITAKSNGTVFPPFMNFAMRLPSMIAQMDSLSYGLMAFRKRLYWEPFTTAYCYIPSVREQSAIADLLKHIDRIIALHQTKLEKLQLLKKAYLQKMFI